MKHSVEENLDMAMKCEETFRRKYKFKLTFKSYKIFQF